MIDLYFSIATVSNCEIPLPEKKDRDPSEPLHQTKQDEDISPENDNPKASVKQLDSSIVYILLHVWTSLNSKDDCFVYRHAICLN